MRWRRCRSRSRRRIRPYEIREVIKRRQDHPRAGRQGGARQQGRGAHDLSVARRPLHRADAQHRPRRRHLPQDHAAAGQEAPEGHRPRARVPEGMGLIIRTAGAARTKQEIKRDFEYLLRLWGASAATFTLESTAPCPRLRGRRPHQALDPRPLHGRRRDPGRRGGRPQGSLRLHAHAVAEPAKSVIKYEAPEPLFARFPIERQLNAMFSPYVTLRSAASSSTRPRPWSPSTSTPARRRADSRSRRRLSTPTWTPPRRSPGSSSCATLPA